MESEQPNLCDRTSNFERHILREEQQCQVAVLLNSLIKSELTRTP